MQLARYQDGDSALRVALALCASPTMAAAATSAPVQSINPLVARQRVWHAGFGSNGMH